MKLQKILKNLPLVFILLNTSGQILAKNCVDSEISSTQSHSKSAEGNFERTILNQVGSVKVTGANGGLKLKSDGG